MNGLLIVGAIALILIVLIFPALRKRAFSRATGSDKTDQPQAPDPSSQTKEEEKKLEYKRILDNLLKLNILVRCDGNLEKETVSIIESIIDDLKETIPRMMEKYPGETLTYELKKTGASHLYNTVKEFLDLSSESRANQFSTFHSTLENLRTVSKRAKEIVEKNETQEFKTMATFLKTKFDNGA